MLASRLNEKLKLKVASFPEYAAEQAKIKKEADAAKAAKDKEEKDSKAANGRTSGRDVTSSNQSRKPDGKDSQSKSSSA